MPEEKTVEGIVTLDTETTMNNKVGGNKASAFCPDNYIVMSAGKGYSELKLNINKFTCTRKFEKNYFDSNPFKINAKPEATIKMLVGQNIKFDLHHLYKASCVVEDVPLQEWLPKNKIWDTQLAEYILTGQECKYASLDGMAIKYGLPVKDSKVKEVFEKGIGADGIEEGTLRDYLEQDVLNTEAIAFKQMQEAYDKKKLPLIESMMDALVAVTDMEYNGLAIDLPLLSDLKQKAEQKVDYLEIDIIDRIRNLHAPLKPHFINIDSNKQLSSILFGGTIEFDTVTPTLLKNGKTRNKHNKYTVTLPQVFDGVSYSESNANGFRIDEEVLTTLCNTAGSISILPWKPIISDILKRKKIKKELNTYYEGLSDLIFPDGLIHHNINMCATETGRTSSSEPNGQNIPSSEDSEVRKLFISRWGKDGRIIKADYKQIEIIALAYLSQDPVLIDDILNGRDVHEQVGFDYYGSGYKMNDDERRVIKTVNFGLIYGGTANSLAEQAGIPAHEVKKIINAFYGRYTLVKRWQDTNIIQVNLSRTYDGATTTKAGYPSGTGVWRSDTGRVYTFHEKDNPFKPGQVNFKPTEIKNYPVQGFATGDLVLTMLGVLWRKMKSDVFKDDCLFVNLVHDEIVFDCKKDIVHTAMNVIKHTLEDTPKYLKQIYNIDLGLPTKVKVTCGDNWKGQDVVAI